MGKPYRRDLYLEFGGSVHRTRHSAKCGGIDYLRLKDVLPRQQESILPS